MIKSRQEDEELGKEWKRKILVLEMEASSFDREGEGEFHAEIMKLATAPISGFPLPHHKRKISVSATEL